ncbi:CBS domain-containing protein [Oceanospirillum multiglobuliferum]|uniref:Cyclic nucleotide-binding protein n=1 Tax=Oceanospirillum multiglobuliferum TaxID=64969 RepID=A0A1T4PYQ0_9GAMM|nr:putative nucleotidyltransferase substrate binding domain-containing protein [Oceanospirillum multiglobuliferum]OPX55440.1 cyclic nucleotide-binding protein [Oceanospirillum multiglobuliferum]SJZ96672.1 CBS domain-containing protein [Oceanospirillum multiglobuliferum]
MEVEQIEIFECLRRFVPFKSLPEEVLAEASRQVEIAYYKAGSQILEFGDTISDLCFVRSGAVEIYRRNGDLYNRLSEGGLFAYQSLLMRQKVRFPVKAIEDSLIYFLPESVFRPIFDEHEEFADFFEVGDQSRLRQAVSKRDDANVLLTSRITTLISREPVLISCMATVQQAAQLMTDEGVSCLLILQPEASDPSESEGIFDYRQAMVSASDGSEHKVCGIITDRDLRTRVVAQGLPFDTSVDEIMSQRLVMINSDEYIFEAMLTMLRTNVHHLPVLKKGRPVGVIALSDLVRYESRNSLFVVSSIFRQQTVEELAALQTDVQASFVRMVNEDANSRMVGSAMAVIGRSFKQRLLELGEEQFGPPPIPYCFLALGSMARGEQLIVTDQDNAIILDDSFNPEKHDEYFAKLAKFVSDGLAACGYSYCTGEVMATNRRWRQPKSVWEQYFVDWIDNPTPESLLHSNIFFDLDGVWGRTEWADQLQGLISRRARRSQRFLACMARNALNRTPPLGFFKTFVMEQDGQHKNAINLKRRGTAPLADLIRVHALAVGSRAQNSFDRLDDVVEAKILPPDRGPDLRDAMEFISMVRIRHQALNIESKQAPDNNIKPENLSHFERRNLKEAFQILSDAQKFLKFRYQPNRAN